MVFSDRGKLKDQYKLFNISKQNSEMISLSEVIERRFKGEHIDLQHPNLIILDGGKVHLSFVLRKLEELGLDKIPVIAISKGARRKADMDLVHTQDGESTIKRGSLAYKFIQEIGMKLIDFRLRNKKKTKKDSDQS